MRASPTSDSVGGGRSPPVASAPTVPTASRQAAKSEITFVLVIVGGVSAGVSLTFSPPPVGPLMALLRSHGRAAISLIVVLGVRAEGWTES